MRTAPASNRLGHRTGHQLLVGCAALLGAGLAACGTDHPVPVDAHLDTLSGDALMSDVRQSSDVRSDARIDVGQDLPPVDVPNLLCEGVQPTMDFSTPYVVANFDTGSNQAFSPFGSGDPVSGNTYISSGVIEDFGTSDWHLTGTVAGDEHFGISWGCSLPSTGGGCTLDTSRFKGIRFKVKGNVGPDNAMTLSLGRAENDPQPVNAGCGTCVVPTDSDASTSDYCRGPRVVFPVGPTERTVTILWTDFADGSPHASIDPHQLTGILWIFHPPVASDSADGGADAGDVSDAATTDSSTAADAGTGIDPDGGVMIVDGDASTGTSSDGSVAGPSYPVDVTIDDIELVPF
jgi:hypothetical protein